MRSLQVIRGGRTRALERVVTRKDEGPEGNRLDMGRKAKVTISEERDVILTTSDNRQDANVIGSAACVSGTEQEPT